MATFQKGVFHKNANNRLQAAVLAPRNDWVNEKKRLPTTLPCFSSSAILKRKRPFYRARRNTIIMLYLIGLGLADETDVTVKGLELIKKVERVYLEAYTSILLVDTAKLVGDLSNSHGINGADLELSTVGSLL